MTSIGYSEFQSLFELIVAKWRHMALEILFNFGSSSALTPVWWQAITRTNVDISSVETLVVKSVGLKNKNKVKLSDLKKILL